MKNGYNYALQQKLSNGEWLTIDEFRQLTPAEGAFIDCEDMYTAKFRIIDKSSGIVMRESK